MSMWDARALTVKWDGGKGIEDARILVIGAGVNGSICAAGLEGGGVDVTVLARGKRYEQVRDEGIVIEDAFKQRRTVSKVPVIDHLEPDDVYDYVLVVVRKNQVAELLPMLAENGSPNTVFMGNNLSGPQEFVDVLGAERVMMGGVWGAGKRDGSVIRAITLKSAASPFGEIDGKITPRLQRLAAVFRKAGFKMELSENIVDFQMTHGVGVAIIGQLVIKHGGNVKDLARATDDLRLFCVARREGQRAMRALGHQVIPWSEAAMGMIPGVLQVLGMRTLLNSRWGEAGLAWHVSQAPDEIQYLAGELQALVDRAGIPAPAIRKVLWTA
jgi:2-dehydropantoate 2-reductase